MTTTDPTKLADGYVHRVEVFAWLGYWRDQMPAEAVSQLQFILNTLRRPIPPPDVAKLREAGEVLRREAFLLLQNSEGCATNHYGGDYDEFGMPGWLVDARERIETAAAAFASQDAPSVAGGMVERYRAAGRREGREAAAVEPGESEVERVEIEFLQALLDRYSENGGIIDLGDDARAFLAIVRRHAPALASLPSRESIVAETVAAIVAWLRSDAVNELHGADQRVEHELADAIERGDWRNSAALQVKP